MRVITERDRRVLVVRMDRVDKRNAVDAAMTAELSAALDRLEDDDLWVGVLTGGPLLLRGLRQLGIGVAAAVVTYGLGRLFGTIIG